MIKNVYWSSCQVPRYSCQILLKIEFDEKFSKNTQIQNFKKFCPVGPEFFRSDGRTDRQT